MAARSAGKNNNSVLKQVSIETIGVRSVMVTLRVVLVAIVAALVLLFLPFEGGVCVFV